MKNLYEFYKKDIVIKFIKKYNYNCIMQIPKIKKITINMGIGDKVSNKNIMKNTISDLTLISGQKPVVTKARKSISNFKIRKGHPIGCKVTLRKKRMWDFFERLIFIAIPRIRDFRGFSFSSFDGRGNYNIGIREQIIFPEINYDKIDQIRGLDIAITTTAKSDEEGFKLFKAFNFPFKEVNSK